MPVDIVNATGSGVAKLSHQCPIWLEAGGVHQDAFAALHERRLEELRGIFGRKEAVHILTHFAGADCGLDTYDQPMLLLPANMRCNTEMGR